MALKEVMSISGYSGLFKFVSQGRNGIIVESLTDGKRTHVSASSKVSALSDISIFTHEGEEPLRKVLDSIKQLENGAPSISHKVSNDELKKYFQKLLPNFDEERVYISDIKKVITWYNQLQNIGMLDFSEEEEEKVEEPVANEDNDEKQVTPKAEAKKADAKKTGGAKKTSAATAKTKAAPKSKPAGGPSKKGSASQRKS
jgi:transcriptional regulator with PAS, ATPase and Fis domain